jgi:FMN phosphatase YigB (HAD superfamily)
MPHAQPVKSLLGNAVDWYGWSFELGTIKPDPAIYRMVCEGLDCRPHQILFVGDTRTADYDGPRASGMHALHLDRRGVSNGPDEIGRLSDVLAWLLR